MPLNNRWSKISRTKNIYLPTVNEYKILNKSSRICSLGSCFADRISYELAKRDINIGEINLFEKDKKNKHLTFPWGSFFNPLNFLDILSHVLEVKKINFNEDTFIKVPKNLTGNHYESSEQYSEIGKFKLINLHVKIKHDFSDYENSLIAVKKNLEKLKKCLIESDTVILTLGLIEAWIDKKNNYSWHAFHGESLKKKSIEDRAKFKKLNFEEVSNCIKQLINLLTIDLKKKLIFTISPVPMAFTFTDKDIVLANRYSKSLLRAAIENFINNKNVFYFPSFEVVVDSVGLKDSYEDDKIHIKQSVFEDFIGPLFFKNFFN